MSHERGSVSPPEGGRPASPTGALRCLFERVRWHLAAWPRRYVEMRIENGPP